MKFSDDTLLNYLNGQADDAEAEAIEHAVSDDPELEARLMALDPIAPSVQQAFAGIPQNTPDVDLSTHERPQKASGLGRFLAVAASVAIIAVSATVWATRPKPMGWTEQAAIYQSLYGPETIAALDPSPQELAAQIGRAEAQLGRALEPDVLASLPGLELKRAQVLSFKGKPLVQIVFADPQGRPLAFCVIRQGDNAPAKDVSHSVLSGLATASWAQDGYGYMLLGNTDRTNLSSELSILKEAFAS